MLSPQTSSAWTQFLHSLQERYGSGSAWLEDEYQSFKEFVGNVPAEDLVPLLLEAYSQYRYLWTTDHGLNVERSIYSILIRFILERKPPVTEEQSFAILRSAYHACGHGGDVAPPLEFALQFYENRPYSRELFDAVNCYRKVLGPLRARGASDAKRKIELLMWHDPQRILHKCYSSRIQLALREMSDSERIPWHVLLRHYSLVMGPSPGKPWFQEARRRLSSLTTEDFVARLDEWFAFPENDLVLITGTGSNVLRTLMWTAALVPDERVPKILRRIKFVHWKDTGSAAKLISALRLIETKGKSWHAASG